MARFGSAARQMEQEDYRAARVAPRALPGGGLDARARQGVTPSFVATVVVVALSVALLVAVGAARIWLTTATVATLRETRSVEEKVEQSRSLRRELQIDRASLSGTDRIERIATQNYGMVYARDVEHMSLSSDEPAEHVEQVEATPLEADASASDEGAVAVDAQDGASATTTEDGDTSGDTGDAGDETSAEASGETNGESHGETYDEGTTQDLGDYTGAVDTYGSDGYDTEGIDEAYGFGEADAYDAYEG